MAESRKPPEVKSNKKYLYHLILFIVSIFIVVVISPREGKFRYEFQKGKPWLSSSLIAPWDFAILKPDYVLARERDSITKNFFPYFKLNPEVEKEQIHEFNTYLDGLLKNYESKSGQMDFMGYVSVKRELNSALSVVYQRGVLQTDETISQEKLPPEVIVVNGRIAEYKQTSSLFEQKSAYQYAKEKKAELENRHASLSGKRVGDFVSE